MGLVRFLMWDHTLHVPVSLHICERIFSNSFSVHFARDNFLILQAFVAFMAYYIFPSLADLPLWNTRGLITVLMLHIGASEPLYYWAHRCFHGKYLFTNYHSLHHESAVPQAFTGKEKVI